MSVLIKNNKKTRGNGRFSCFLVLVISLFLIPCISYADVAGKVIFSIGKAQIKSVSGEITRLRRGDQVNNGDTIITSRKAQVQIRMVDNALISVRPDSQFVLEQYVYKENPEEDKSYMKLVKGGFRSVTGQIGKRNKNNYKVSTVVGTIGIRGTDFTAMLCNSDCGRRGGNGDAKIDNGLYVGVLSGGVSLKNEAGESSLDNQQYAHVASVRSAPKRMPAPPGFLMFDRTKAEKPGAGQKKETEKEDSKKQKKEKEKSKVKESAKEKEKSKEKDKSKEKEKDKSENKEKKDVKATGDKKTSEEKTEDAEKDKNKEQDKKSESKTTDEKDTGEKSSGEENSGEESSDSKESN
ncbi:MAG: FecR domain-containing protein, partial [Gammaproteobacteria bacterium]|nr:FecR domain-containing protein [Gammaproteobacteria bacterium]